MRVLMLNPNVDIDSLWLNKIILVERLYLWPHTVGANLQFCFLHKFNLNSFYTIAFKLNNILSLVRLRLAGLVLIAGCYVVTWY